MARGFIRSPFQIKLLILYILARMEYPIDTSALTDLALCDEGVDYFQLIEELNSLIATDHVLRDGERLSITPKGRANGSVCESELPYSVRISCDRSTTDLNKILRRQNYIQAQVRSRPEGGCTIHFALDDDEGNVMTLEMAAPDMQQAQLAADNFKKNAEQIYNVILTALFTK